jgi:tetratricopeptide (TPR) repeat protein
VNAPLIAEICYRLDGLPLAIELAAARSRVLTPQVLLGRVRGVIGEKLLDILIGGARNRPTYQQTLRGTIEWSYRLLIADEQVLFARLAVFVGSSTIEAAEMICQLPAQLPIDILNGLTSLVDKSLLQQIAHQDGEPRFRMLETIREYALERLTERDEREQLQVRYADWVLGLVEHAHARLQTSDEAAWLDKLEMEHENINGAMNWALELADPTLVGRLSSALSEFCWIRGYVTLGRHWLRGPLARSELLPLSIRAKVLSRAGMLAWIQSDYSEAQQHCGAALAYYRELSDVNGITWTLRHLAYIAWDQGDHQQTTDLLTESLACARAARDQSGSARALHLLGWVAVLHNDETQATAYYQECLDLCRMAGDQQFVAHALNDLGLVWYRKGQYLQSTALLEEGLRLRRELRVDVGIAWSCLNLGLVACAQGQYELATTRLNESLRMRRDIGDRRGIAECLEALAAVSSHMGQLIRAVRLYGFAARLRALIGSKLPAFDHANHEQLITQLRVLLGAEAYELGWAAGQRMVLDQVLVYGVR